MTRSRRTLLILSGAALVASSLAVLNGPPASAAPFGYAQLNTVQKRLVSGLLAAELNPADAARARAAAQTGTRPAGTADACASRFGSNVKVNQNCLNLSDTDLQGRSQAQNETWMAVDPRNGDHLVASYNDYRRGDGTCGVSYSLDGGTAGRTPPPRTASPGVRRSAAHPASTGRPAATPRWPGTAGVTRT